MKQLKLFSLLAGLFALLPLLGQVETEVVVTDEPMTPEEYYANRYYGMNQNYVDFTTDQKKFNDWTIGLYGGINMIQGSDFNTLVRNQDPLFSYDFHATITKQLTHAFGLALQGSWGRTEQQMHARGPYRAHTEYYSYALLGDLNMSMLFRRVDNKSRFAWALHTYAGLGLMGYTAYRKPYDADPSQFQAVGSGGGGFGSLYATGGTGLRYKLSQRLDMEAKAMYIWTGDDQFDGSGEFGELSDIRKRSEDGFFTFSLGLLYKPGRHFEHLSWADPLADIYPGPSPDELSRMLVVCQSGDQDDDGVCDDWDRELNTPPGARVDGAGRALDTDLDGIIDLYDECVTLPGPASNNGCPEDTSAEELLTLAIANLEFSLDSDVISPGYYPLLDNAARYLKHYSHMTFDVVGHTDTRASDAYNMDLSRRRASNVKQYLVEKHGIPASQLNVVAKGFHELRFPECRPATSCPEWKNHANRRVVFVQK
ncbi:MAG: OmpA family protein [Weeksellaceae bacterium]|nr:OmpA family protein [Weeksellaceae bacterium]